MIPRVALLVSLVGCPAAAARLAPEDVPPALKPWVGWVLQGHEEQSCPFLEGRPDDRPCAWPGTLSLILEEKGARFETSWRVYAETWAPLPGDAQHWPMDLRVDGVAAPAVERGAAPAVRLKPGLRRVSGSLRWERLPELLQVPLESGLLEVTLDGRRVSAPARDDLGRLWVRKRDSAGAERAHLEVAVHRLLSDGVPLTLATQVQLRVSGAGREVVLGRALPEGFTAMALSSPLPARLEPDGRLRVQARAGTWTLQLDARGAEPAVAVRLPSDPAGPWDADEAWAFAAAPRLRVVSIEGAPPLDPAQTEIPASWRGFPAFLMKPGGELRLLERRRGEAEPQPDRLAVHRSLWLDFDGRGYTAQDQISGTLGRSWRLTAGPGTALGRVSIAGQDQFITALSPGGPAGVEVREGQVRLSGDSRVEGGRYRLPAVGWAHDVDSLGAVLNLPPGWRLLHATGVDRAEPSWIGGWTLLDLFLVLILSLAVGKLWGPGWGAVALAATALSWHEPGAPRRVWLVILACEALARALPDGSARRASRLLRAGSWAALALLCVPFFVAQVKEGLFPQLGRRAGGAPQAPGFAASAPEPAEPAEELDAGEASAVQSMEGARKKELSARQAFKGAQASEGKALARDPAVIVSQSAAGYEETAPAKQMLALDPRAQLNTGPGVPTWSWHSVLLAWEGPVSSRQPLTLWLLGPCSNLALALSRVLLVALLGFLLAGLPVAERLRELLSAEGRRGLLRRVLPVLLLAALPAAGRAQSGAAFPPPEILEDLRSRLLARPECAPRCAESPRMRLEASPESLRLRVELHADAPTAVPLPGGARQWTPARALLDGASAPVRRSSDGSLWLALTAGAHEAVLEGPLPDADTVQIALPLKPRRVELAVSGWTLHGVREDGSADDSLQLSRARGRPGLESRLQPGELPPFFHVSRLLRLALSWEVETTVSRRTPAGMPAALDVPLLPGESVTSADLRVTDGKVRVALAPQAMSFSWRSTLEEAGSIALTAAAGPWSESWTLDAAPIWHTEASGIPTVLREPAPGRRARRWQPWPGESAAIQVSRPDAVAGQTMTIDRAALRLSPGLRASDASLDLGLRSSRGAQHGLELPEGAQLLSVHVDGRAQPARQEGRKVVLDLPPGAHDARLAWREERGVRALYRAPAVGLGAPAVNASVELAMPQDRWTLFVGGPRLGPVVLFWPLLLVFLGVSGALGRLGRAPLGWRQWLLLSIGLTQVPVVWAALIPLWFFALSWRKERSWEKPGEFDLMQVFLMLMTATALFVMFRAIKQGLLGAPDMQIGGNDSSGHLLRWYQDRAGGSMPRPWAFSAPLFAYRLAMLAWALWLANSLIGWLRWAWQCFCEGGLWKELPALRLSRPVPPKREPPPPPAL